MGKEMMSEHDQEQPNSHPPRPALTSYDAIAIPKEEAQRLEADERNEPGRLD